MYSIPEIYEDDSHEPEPSDMHIVELHDGKCHVCKRFVAPDRMTAHLKEHEKYDDGDDD